MEMAGEYPDIVIGCAGGGSNFAGFAYPFVHKNLTEGRKRRSSRSSRPRVRR
jgi:tryptophan synthase beta chain